MISSRLLCLRRHLSWTHTLMGLPYRQVSPNFLSLPYEIDPRPTLLIREALVLPPRCPFLRATCPTKLRI